MELTIDNIKSIFSRPGLPARADEKAALPDVGKKH